MDLLALSGGSVLAAGSGTEEGSQKMGRARQIWACIEDDFVASMGAVESGGQIWQYATTRRTPSCVLMLRGAGVEGSRGTRGIGKMSRLIIKFGSWG